MSIKTFRGLLVDGQQERIRLETRDGKTGYRIKKLQVITHSPADSAPEAILKIFSIPQTTVTAKIDFSDQTLLAAAFYNQDSTAANIVSEAIVFDIVTFNQNIHLTYIDDNAGSATKLNYYLELEQISLDDVEATAVILKNFRNTNTVV